MRRWHILHYLTISLFTSSDKFMADADVTNSNYFRNTHPYKNITCSTDSFISKNIYKGKAATYFGNVLPEDSGKLKY